MAEVIPRLRRAQGAVGVGYRQDRLAVTPWTSSSFPRLSGLWQANPNAVSGGAFPRGQDPQMLMIN